MRILGSRRNAGAAVKKVAPVKSEVNIELPEVTIPGKSLSDVLDQSEHVNNLVKESAKELSSVNTAIKQELATQDVPATVANVIEKSEAVESKVQEASDQLTMVNQALEVEVRERIIVDHQLAAAIEQKDVAQHAALHDALTGLSNRALFNDRLEHGIAQVTRHGGKLAVMFVDLDKFKSVNDMHGHAVGDDVLRITAQRLKEQFRDADTVSRHGGDEFLCLLTEFQNESNIGMIAEKIIKAMQVPCNVKVRDISVSLKIGASIGIAIFPQDGNTSEALVKSADEAMYEAKKSEARCVFAH